MRIESHGPLVRPRFGGPVGLPKDIFVAQNAVFNREVVDLLGYTPGVVIPARNQYERIERAGDVVVWLLLGVGLPWLVGHQLFRKRAAQSIAKAFDLKPKTQPLNATLEQLDQNVLQSASGRKQLMKTLGLKHAPYLQALRDRVLKTKLDLMRLDQFFIITQNVLWAFGKVKITEHLSGKKGFVGEFGYTSDAYRERKNESAQKQSKWRLGLSLLLGYGSVLALPWGVGKLLNHPTRLLTWGKAQGLTQKLKAMVPLFNYTNVIFMSKACLVWPALFGWEASNILASRDSHEVRERLISAGFLNFSYFFADELFSGLLGKGMMRWHGAKLSKTPLITKGPLGMPLLKPLHQIYQTYGEGLALKYARWSYWPGLVGAAALTGFGITILNNVLTRQKVLADQKQMPSSLSLEAMRPKPTTMPPIYQALPQPLGPRARFG